MFLELSIFSYGFKPLLFIAQTIVIGLDYYSYHWIIKNWEDKPYLKYTIGLAIIYFLGWELMFNLLPAWLG